MCACDQGQECARHRAEAERHDDEEQRELWAEQVAADADRRFALEYVATSKILRMLEQ